MSKNALACLSLALAAGSIASADELIVPDQFPTIQSAIEASVNGDVVIVQPGTYAEQINTLGKAITVRSTDPSDPGIVAQTVIDGSGGRAISIFTGESVNTVVEGFTVTGGQSDKGGGLAIFGSDPTIRDMVFTGNQAAQGGAVYITVSSSLLERCRFEGNSADRGGAVYLYATTRARIHDSTFIGNEAARNGGAISSRYADLRLYRCVLAENTAGSWGGAYEGKDALLFLVGSLVRDNLAERGGALYVDDESPRILNSTIVRNVALFGEGGAVDGLFSQPLVRNSIVRDNGQNQFGGFSVNPTPEYSNAQDVPSGPGVIDVDPLFVDPGANDFRLQAGSPSVDTAFNGWVASYELGDLDGRPRIMDQTADMGAYERSGAFVEPTDVDGRLFVGLKDDGNLAYGLPLPIAAYDVDTNTWSTLVENLPAFALAADAVNECLWVQNGETGLLNRVPFDSPAPEEIGLLKNGNATASIAGMAVRDGVLYAVTSLGGQGLYIVDTSTGRLELVAPIPLDYQVWDLEYDPETDAMLLLSSAGSQPGDLLGIYEIDLNSFEITPVQEWFNYDPFNQAPALQGLAVGGDRNFILRSLYNDLQVFDSASLGFIGSVSIPNVPGQGWVLGGLSWRHEGAGDCAPDMNGDRKLDIFDFLAFQDMMMVQDPRADCDGNSAYDIFDLVCYQDMFARGCSF